MRRRTLLTRVLIANLLLISVAVVAAGIARTPTASSATIRGRARARLRVALTVLVNLFMIQRRFEPLERLIDDDGEGRPGALRARPRRPRSTAVARPRRSSASSSRSGACSSASKPSAAAPSSAALQAQEEERARVARDLHDEVNQSLTGVLLQLEAAREKAPPELDRELAETKATGQPGDAASCSRSPATLRPTALDDLGLKAALAGHVERARAPDRDRGELRGRGRLLRPRARDPARRLPRRPGGALERVRHSRRRARPRPPRAHGAGLELTVSDDGRGFTLDEAERRPRDRRDARARAARRRRARDRVASRPSARASGCEYERDDGTSDEDRDRRRPRDRALRPARCCSSARRTSRSSARPPTASRRATSRSPSAPTSRSSTSRCRS